MDVLGVVEEVKHTLGVLWSCRALTVPREPLIRFRASESSACNGVSSTRIRRIMCEARAEDLYGELEEHVLSCEFLVQWLQDYRESKATEANWEASTNN